MKPDLFSLIPNDWARGLASVSLDIAEIDELIRQTELEGACVVPYREKIFAALSLKPENVSVIVIGQDPYPNLAQATGMAFAVGEGTQPLPGSLRNIFKEIAADIGSPSTSDCTLTNWTRQGVLLLNTSLTTELGVRAAHASWPWDSIVRAILSLVIESNPEVVAILWGKQARQFAQIFDSNSIVQSAHPSPLSANRGFFGSKSFSRVNEILERQGRQRIVW